ncbi:glycoside hydrolase family 79 protein [Trichoderma austrokoningii]
MRQHTFVAALLLLPAVVAAPSSSTNGVAALETVRLGASQIVDHAFASFSFPVHCHPKLFSRDILDLSYAMTGKHPDRTYYNTSQELSIQVDAGANGIPSSVYIGPVYFKAFNNFSSSLWSFQANLANNANWGLNNTIQLCKRVMNTLKSNLIDFEIGNEVDLHPYRVRPCGYTVYDFLQEGTRYTDAILENVLKGDLPNAFNGGIDLTHYVKSVFLHHYAAGHQAWVRLQDNLTCSIAVVSSNLGIYSSANNYLESNYPDVTFLLGETNSDYTNLLMSQVEGVFGSSLWLIDYLMYGMSLVSDVIGHNPEVQIFLIDLNSELWKFSAYGVYESSKLRKFKVSLRIPYGSRGVTVQRLLGPGASADSGISWGGLSWNYTQGRLAQSGRPHYETLPVSRGEATLLLHSTEAIVVTLDQPIY